MQLDILGYNDVSYNPYLQLELDVISQGITVSLKPFSFMLSVLVSPIRIYNIGLEYKTREKPTM